MTAYNFTIPNPPVSLMTNSMLCDVATTTSYRISSDKSETVRLCNNKITGGHI